MANKFIIKTARPTTPTVLQNSKSTEKTYSSCIGISTYAFWNILTPFHHLLNLTKKVSLSSPYIRGYELEMDWEIENTLPYQTKCQKII